MRFRPTTLAWVLATLSAIPLVLGLSQQELGPQLQQLFGSDNSTGTASTHTHTNNWAVLVSASRYWFNYRHMANTLAMYRTIKRLGIPDSNIILMLADDVACNARNSFPATVYANSGRQMDLYGNSIEVDYRGYEVTVESFLRLLTGRHDSSTPRSKRLLSDASSNVFLYMTGHGGNEFLKFQDNEEVSAYDVADAVEQMWEKRRYNKLLYVIDTCQANTMYSKFYSPEIISTGSSSLGENSYSHHNDMDIGVAVIDSFTHTILQYLETLVKSSRATISDLFNTYDPAKIHSHPGISTDLSTTSPEDTLITDFFGGVASVEVLHLPEAEAETSDRIECAKALKAWQVAPVRERHGTKSIGEQMGQEVIGYGLSHIQVEGTEKGHWINPLEKGNKTISKIKISEYMWMVSALVVLYVAVSRVNGEVKVKAE